MTLPRTEPRRVAAILAVLFACFFVQDTAVAQTRGQLKRELKERQKQAAEDTDKLHEAAIWAKEVGLERESKKLLESILDIDPDHAPTRASLGFVQVGGEWMEIDDARETRAERLEESFKDAGLKEVDGIYVEKERVDDAEAGRFWHDGERVSRQEKLALQSGMVRHPETGVLIDDFDLPKAEAGLYPTPEGWVDEAAADELAKSGRHLWILRSYNTWILGSHPLQTLKERAGKLDTAIEKAARLLNVEVFPEPQFRPTVWFVSSTDEYNQVNNDLGDGGSAYGACLTAPEAAEITINGQRFGRVAIVNENESWTPYWTTHAAGLAYTSGLAQSFESELPRWFLRGVAGKIERLPNPGLAKFFGDQHLTKGGVGDLADWFSNFTIDPSLDSRRIDFNVYQAGLLLDYAAKSGSADVKEAFAGIRSALEAGPGKQNGARLRAAVEALQAALIADEEGVKAHFQQILQG